MLCFSMTEADYYIKCTEEDSDGNLYRVRASGRLEVLVTDMRLRERVLRDIVERNMTVMTAFEHKGEWHEGEVVRPYKGLYLRTDRNEVESDNLGELPDCEESLFRR